MSQGSLINNIASGLAIEGSSKLRVDGEEGRE